MSQINAFTIQQSLRQQEFVSVPWIQREYSLSYSEAKRFLEQLLARGWVDKQPCGNRYPVREDNLRLRAIQRHEVDTLFDRLTSDCVSALECMHRKNGGATLTELRIAVRGEDDTKEALEILTELNLSYKWEELYFSCVSGKTVEVMSSVEAAKRRLELHRKIGTGLDNLEKCKQLYDALFDE